MGNTFTSSPPPVQHKPSEKYRGSYHLLCNESGFMQLRFRMKPLLLRWVLLWDRGTRAQSLQVLQLVPPLHVRDICGDHRDPHQVRTITVHQHRGQRNYFADLPVRSVRNGGAQHMGREGLSGAHQHLGRKAVTDHPFLWGVHPKDRPA
mgnify:CR=1 FL=1